MIELTVVFASTIAQVTALDARMPVIHSPGTGAVYGSR